MEFFQIKVQGVVRQSKVGLLSTIVFLVMGMGKVNKAVASGTTNNHQQQTITTMKERSMQKAHGGERKSMDRKVQVEMSVTASAKDHHQGRVEDIVGRGTTSHSHGSHSHSHNTHSHSTNAVVKHTSHDAKKQHKHHGIRTLSSSLSRSLTHT